MRRFESCLPLHFDVHRSVSLNLNDASSFSLLHGPLASMNTETNHISVCICTYKRPEFLKRLVNDLISQETQGLFTFSIVVADNDRLRSAEPLVTEFAAASAIRIKYCVQPQQNIALTRNKAIENADGDFIAFIDDDEFPAKDWLITLYKTCKQYQVDGVLGPVRRHFDQKPPKWILKGNFYERERYETGTVLAWREGRTGNLLLRTRILDGETLPFRPQFPTAEDQDFFRRMIEKGHSFVWCDEAIAYEVVPPIRWKRTIMLKRALMRGAVTLLHPTFGARDIAKSAVAIPMYTAALPFALVMGQHRFMNVAIRLFDHLGKVLAVMGIRPIKEVSGTG
jgi:succinoglycan biosynthesis protein ExoM